MSCSAASTLPPSSARCSKKILMFLLTYLKTSKFGTGKKSVSEDCQVRIADVLDEPQQAEQSRVTATYSLTYSLPAVPNDIQFSIEPTKVDSTSKHAAELSNGSIMTSAYTPCTLASCTMRLRKLWCPGTQTWLTHLAPAMTLGEKLSVSRQNMSGEKSVSSRMMGQIVHRQKNQRKMGKWPRLAEMPCSVF
ncbi:uncharacterized protein LOC144112526 isoform X1 [Amblyomma americanum]